MTHEEFIESLKKFQTCLKSETVQAYEFTGFVVPDSGETGLCAVVKKESIDFAIRIKGTDGTFFKIGNALHMTVEQAREIALSLAANGPISLITIHGRAGWNYLLGGKFPPNHADVHPISEAPERPTPVNDLSGDMLHGAEAIAEFFFGDPKQRRKIYHMAETQSLPTFRMGGILCARKSTLMKWIEEQEQRK